MTNSAIKGHSTRPCLYTTVIHISRSKQVNLNNHLISHTTTIPMLFVELILHTYYTLTIYIFFIDHKSRNKALGTGSLPFVFGRFFIGKNKRSISEKDPNWLICFWLPCGNIRYRDTSLPQYVRRYVVDRTMLTIISQVRIFSFCNKSADQKAIKLMVTRIKVVPITKQSLWPAHFLVVMCHWKTPKMSPQHVLCIFYLQQEAR